MTESSRAPLLHGLHLPKLKSGNQLMLAGAVMLACSREPPPRAELASAVAKAPMPSALPSASPASASKPPLPSREPPTTQQTVQSDEPPIGLAGTHPLWIVDEPIAVGPAAPATASALGVVMITRADQLRLAPLGKLSRKVAPAPSPITPLPSSGDSFELARGAAIASSRAYWISARRLLVQSLAEPHSVPNVLANDAEDGTRVAVSEVNESIPPCAAYIARTKEEPPRLIAKLWTLGAAIQTLTPDGAAANSVGLAPSDSGLLAWSVEGRTSMTPIHAREIRFQGSTPLLLDDRVVWIAGASQPFTEITPLPATKGPPRALLPAEQDVTHFGLLTVTLSDQQHEATASWSLYPNGLDPAPVATTELCGARVIARVKPQSTEGATPQALEIISADGSKTPGLIAAFAQRFFDISLVGIEGGALLVSVADARTWATTLRCRKR